MASSEFTSPVRVEIPSARSAGIKSKYTVYVIVVSWVNSGNAWTTQRRFREFSKLHKTLSEVFQRMPPLPPKTIWGITQTLELAFVEKRRALLEKYLQELIKIEGMMNTVSLCEFLEIPSHVQLSTLSVPVEVSSLKERQFGINQFILDEKSGAIFTACEEVKILNRMDAHLSNIRMPWEEQGCISPVGSFSCWKKGRKGLWQLVGTQFYDCPVSCVAYNPVTKTLYSALQTGDIAGYRVDMDRAKKAFTLSSELKGTHASRITHMHVDQHRNLLISSGNDKKLKITKLATGTSRKEFVFNGKLSTFAVEEDRNRLFVACNDKNIYIVDLELGEIVMTLQGHTSPVNALHFIQQRRYLFSGGRDYKLGLWGIKNKRDVLMSELVGFLKRGPPTPITKIQLCEQKMIITGHGKGYVAIWTLPSGHISLVFRGHKSKITGLKWLDGPKILITSSDDCIRFWQFPKDLVLCRTLEASPSELKARKTSQNTQDIDSSPTTIDYDEFISKEPYASKKRPVEEKKLDKAQTQTQSHPSPEPKPVINSQPTPVEDAKKDVKKEAKTEPQVSSIFKNVSLVDSGQQEDRPTTSSFLTLSKRYVKSEAKAKPETSSFAKSSSPQAKLKPNDDRKTQQPPKQATEPAKVTPSEEIAPEPQGVGVEETEGGKQTDEADENVAPEAKAEMTEEKSKKLVKSNASGVDKKKQARAHEEDQEEDDEDIFSVPKGKKAETIRKFANLFGTEADDDGTKQKSAMKNLFGDDDGDMFS
ncbi:hypothetical protein AAMO2058_001533200 [Amorphochlora amoebiformis]